MRFDRQVLGAGMALALASGGALAAECTLEGVKGDVEVLGNEFPALQDVLGVAESCAGDGLTVGKNLTVDHKDIQVAALTANPSQYSAAFVANGSLVPLLNDALVRPLNDLVAEYGQDIPDSQKIAIGGDVYAIAFLANAQHLMYRTDVLERAGVEVPTTYEDVLEAAKRIKDAGLMDFPLIGTYKAGWDLAEEFVNMYTGYDGELFVPGTAEPDLQTDAAMRALETMKSLAAYMNPDFLTFDSNAASAEFEQGKAAIMNMWGSRAGNVLDDQGAVDAVRGNIGFAAAPTVGGGSTPASTLWWDGFVIPKNVSDENAAASFQVLLQGITTEVANEFPDDGVWLIEGYEPTKAAEGVLATAQAGAKPYPMLPYVNLMHTALGNELVEFMQGSESAEKALKDATAAYTAAAKEGGFL